MCESYPSHMQKGVFLKEEGWGNFLLIAIFQLHKAQVKFNIVSLLQNKIYNTCKHQYNNFPYELLNVVSILTPNTQLSLVIEIAIFSHLPDLMILVKLHLFFFF